MKATCEPANFFEPEIRMTKYIFKAGMIRIIPYDLVKNIKIPPKEARKIGFSLTEELSETRNYSLQNGTMNRMYA